MQILLNRAARIILNADWYTSSHVFFKWMSISQRKYYHISCIKFSMDSHHQPVMCLNLMMIVIILETLQALFSKFLTLTQNYLKKVLDTVGQFCGIVYQPMYMMHVILIILNLC